MAYAHDGDRVRSLTGARPGDGSFLFLGRSSLDFANTAGRGSADLLGAPGDLRRWIRAGFDLVTDVSDQDFAEATALRAACLNLIVAALDDAVLRPVDMAVVNSVARSPILVRQLDRSPRGWRWFGIVSAREALAALARDLIDILAVGPRDRLRICSGEDCSLRFFDDSRSGARRWCAPQRCGDRARAQAYRARRTM